MKKATKPWISFQTCLTFDTLKRDVVNFRQLPPGFVAAANLTTLQHTQDEFFLQRKAPLNGLDAVAFHYSFYRAMSRFLGMGGNLQGRLWR